MLRSQKKWAERNKVAYCLAEESWSWLKISLQDGVGRSQHQDNVEYLYASLKQVYKKAFVPIEEYYSYPDFFSPIMSDNDIGAHLYTDLLQR